MPSLTLNHRGLSVLSTVDWTGFQLVGSVVNLSDFLRMGRIASRVAAVRSVADNLSAWCCSQGQGIYLPNIVQAAPGLHHHMGLNIKRCWLI